MTPLAVTKIPEEFAKTYQVNNLRKVVVLFILRASGPSLLGYENM